MKKLEVIAAFDWLEQEETVGTLSHDTLYGVDKYFFTFSEKWLSNHYGVFLGDDLRNFPGMQESPHRNHLFGGFGNCLPDHWGKFVIELKWREDHGMGGRLTYKLSDWVYLHHVADFPRAGGFRLKDPDTGNYLGVDDDSAIPSVVTIESLLDASQCAERAEYDNTRLDKRWIDLIFKNGSSLGGARPKACFKDGNVLYVAKFPSIYDVWNYSRWEYFANRMAAECGITTTETKILTLDKNRDIFLSKRFDRTTDGKRIHMASALDLLGMTTDDMNNTYSYSDICDLITSLGSGSQAMLEELYRRVALTICLANGDDHLKNHSFLLTKKGWVLSPVYDINPEPSHQGHSLLIDGISNASSLDNLFAAHKMYHLDEDTAYGIIKEVLCCMKYWESLAEDCGLDGKNINMFRDSFEDGMRWKCSSAYGY